MFPNNSENAQGSGAPGAPAMATPTPNASPAPAAPTSIDVKALVEALKNPEAAALIKDLARREDQSIKDRRIGKIEQKLGDFESRLAEYKELTGQGLSHGLALRLMQATSAEAAEEPVSAAQVLAQGSANNAPSADHETLEVLGLDPSSPEVTALVLRNAPIGDYLALAKTKRARPAPNPATVMPMPAGTPASGDELDTVTQELMTAMLNPVKNAALIRELTAKQAALLPRN